MKTSNPWIVPVAASLMLHTLFIVFAISVTDPDRFERSPKQALTVKFIAQTADKPSSIVKISPEKPQVIKQKIENKKVEAEIEKIVELSNKTEVQAANKIEDKEISNTEQTAVQRNIVAQLLSKLTRPPAFVSKIEPVYPRSEQRSGTEAYVLVEITLDEKGSVFNVRIVKSAGAAFDNAVQEAIKKSRFKPGYIDKEPVAVKVLVPFRFNLK